MKISSKVMKQEEAFSAVEFEALHLYMMQLISVEMCDVVMPSSTLSYAKSVGK